MSIPIHIVEVLDGSTIGANDRIVLGNFPAVANVAGASAGAAVTIAFVFKKPVKVPYSVLVSPNQDATCSVTSKTAAGFTVTLYPRLAASTLAAGSNSIVVVG